MVPAVWMDRRWPGQGRVPVSVAVPVPWLLFLWTASGAGLVVRPPDGQGGRADCNYVQPGTEQLTGIGGEMKEGTLDRIGL